jgi:hypothetical protein
LFAVDSEGLSALQKSSFNNHLECVSLLLDAGGNELLELLDHAHSSALHKAAFSGHSEMCELLLSRGAQVDAEDDDAVVPLHNAAFNNHIDCIKTLLNRHAQIDKASKSGNTALHYAALNGNIESLVTLLQAGAAPNRQDKKGLTPLHYAVKKDSVPAVTVLLEHHADPNVRDLKNRRALKLRCHTPAGRQIYTLLSVRGGSGKSSKASMRVRAKRNTPAVLVTTAPSSSSQAPHSLSHTLGPDADDHDRSFSETSASGLETHTKISTSAAHLPTSVSMMKLAHPASSGKPASSAAPQIPLGYRRDRHGFLVKTDSSLPAMAPASPSTKKVRSAARKKNDVELKWAKALKKWGESQKSSTTIVSKYRDFIRKHCERGLPDSVRGQVWRTILQVDETRDAAMRAGVPTFTELVNKETEWSAIIQRDINRTFPNHFLFQQDKGQGQQALHSVLVAYSNYNPKVGYCQGMGFIVALFLMYFHSEQDAFWALVRLLDPQGYGMEGIYSPNMPMVNECVYIFERLLKAYLPKLGAHFAEQGVEGGLYVPQLFITVFLYNMPFDICLRIWDRFLIDGFLATYPIAIAIFKMFEDTLLSFEFDRLMQFLKFDNNQEIGAAPVNINPEELFKTVSKLNIKLKHVQKLRDDYRIAHPRL